MPTGTGKTGVIATLSVAVPPEGWTLVLTPWDNLCRQLVRQLRSRFWERIDWRPRAVIPVSRLYPSSANALLRTGSAQRVLVSSFASLVQIRKKLPREYSELSDRIAEILVDEGHYEPAVEWGRAIKSLGKPTLLLTATPYRNDLRLFRVAQEDTFNFTHANAEKKLIVRHVDSFVDLGVEEPTKSSDIPNWCRAFRDHWLRRKRRGSPASPRAIVRCTGMATVKRVTKELRRLGLDALGVHDRFGQERSDWLVRAAPNPNEVSYEVWVHERKLTEGLDDHRFCVLAFVNQVRNDRTLVQQIGRVLRPTPTKVGEKLERANVFHSSGLRVERSWHNYRAFETASDLVATERYRAMVDALLRQQPPMEYFGNRFRRRFDPSSSEIPEQLLLRASTIVRRLHSSFSWPEFVECASDELMLQDRLLLGPSSEPLVGPYDSRLWIYASISNSSLLREHAHYEIRLGVSVAVRHNDLCFLASSESTPTPAYLLETSSKLSADELARALEGDVTPKHTSLVNAWPTTGAVARTSVSSANLENTPARLTDSAFLCSSTRVSAAAQVGTGTSRQYLGFNRSRVSEQLRASDQETFTLEEFCQWTGELEARVTDPGRTLPQFYERYLLPVAAPLSVDCAYLVATPSEDVLVISDASGNAFELSEFILTLETCDPGRRWDFELSLRSLEAPSTTLTRRASLLYDVQSRTFRIESESLNSEFLATLHEGGKSTGLVTFFNNHNESYGVLLADAVTYYSAHSFYRIDYRFAEERLASLLKPMGELGRAQSEKGTWTTRTRTWKADSLFHLLDRNGPFLREFGAVELLFCDDMQTEVADFVFADFSRRKIAFAHAKHGSGNKVSASALHEVVGQALKNLSVVSRGGGKPAHLSRWNRAAKWNNTAIRRWRKGAKSLPENEKLWSRIRAEILDHPNGTVEVWLVLGATLRSDILIEQMRSQKKRTAVTGQVLRLLAGLHSACAEQVVDLKVFCD